MANDSGHLVLLVEDNLDHAELVMRSLAEHRLPMKVTHLRDGQAALDYLFREGEWADPNSSPRPHVLLLDLRLPRVDGLEVLRKIKESENLSQLPVVILTTSAAERDIAKAYDRRANSYLIKPLDFSQFRRLMEDLGVYWLGWNASPLN
jgi:two-component system, response regulator